MATRTTKKAATKKSVARKKTTKKTPAKKPVTRKKKNNSTTSKSTKNASNKLSLNTVLAINDVKRLYAELSKFPGTKKNILIDASKVEMVDTAILQVLLAFVKKAQVQDVSVTWVEPSQEFMNRAEMLDLTGLLGLREAS